MIKSETEFVPVLREWWGDVDDDVVLSTE